MKVYLKRNPITPTGFELECTYDDGHVEHVPVTDVTKDGKSYILPDNPSKRKYWSVKRVDEVPVELTLKEPKTFGPRASTGERKKLSDYLTDEERATIEGIWQACRERRDAERNKPMSEEEKLLAKIAKYQAQLDALKNGGDAQ